MATGRTKWRRSGEESGCIENQEEEEEVMKVRGERKGGEEEESN